MVPCVAGSAGVASQTTGILPPPGAAQVLAVDAGRAGLVVLSDGRKVTLPLRSPGPVARSVLAPDALALSGTVSEAAPVVRLDE